MTIKKKCKKCKHEIVVHVDDKDANEAAKRALFSMAAQSMPDKCTACGGPMGPPEKVKD